MKSTTLSATVEFGYNRKVRGTRDREVFPMESEVMYIPRLLLSLLND